MAHVPRREGPSAGATRFSTPAHVRERVVAGSTASSLPPALGTSRCTPRPAGRLQRAAHNRRCAGAEPACRNREAGARRRLQHPAVTCIGSLHGFEALRHPSGALAGAAEGEQEQEDGEADGAPCGAPSSPMAGRAARQRGAITAGPPSNHQCARRSRPRPRGALRRSTPSGVCQVRHQRQDSVLRLGQHLPR